MVRGVSSSWPAFLHLPPIHFLLPQFSVTFWFHFVRLRSQSQRSFTKLHAWADNLGSFIWPTGTSGMTTDFALPVSAIMYGFLYVTTLGPFLLYLLLPPCSGLSLVWRGVTLSCFQGVCIPCLKLVIGTSNWHWICTVVTATSKWRGTWMEFTPLKHLKRKQRDDVSNQVCTLSQPLHPWTTQHHWYCLATVLGHI